MSCEEPHEQIITEGEYWKHLTALELDSSARFDKNLVTLSTGALGVSLIFLPRIESSVILLWLGVSWILLTISLGLSLYSHLTSQWTAQALLNELTDQHANCRWSGVTNCLNKWAFWTFVSGVVIMLASFLISVGMQNIKSASVELRPMIKENVSIFKNDEAVQESGTEGRDEQPPKGRTDAFKEATKR